MDILLENYEHKTKQYVIQSKQSLLNYQIICRIQDLTNNVKDQLIQNLNIFNNT